jgi:hypothetical protein
VGRALAFLLARASLGLLLFGTTEIAAIARFALVSGGTGFLKRDGDRLAPALDLAAFAVPAALEFSVLELMHDPAGNTFLPRGFARH